MEVVVCLFNSFTAVVGKCRLLGKRLMSTKVDIEG